MLSTQRPSLLAPLPLDLKPAATAATPPRTQVLDYVTQNQFQTNWCWVAVATSIAAYYTPATTWTQCKFVNAVNGWAGCCNSPTPAYCNIGGQVDVAMSKSGNLGYVSPTTPTFGTFCGTIDAGTPLVVNVSWDAGGAHSVTLYGYTTPQVVYIADPDLGYSAMNYGDFPTKYHTGSTWTDTVYPKAP